MTRSFIIIIQVFFAVYWIGLSCICSAYAAESSKEYQLKAGFLVNFVRFISWPDNAFASPEADIVFCVVGDNPFGNALDGVHLKKIGNRHLQVVYVPTLQSVPPCHLLYVAQSEKKDLVHLSKHIASQPLVAVSDIEGFAEAGGGIEFITQNNRLAFIINYTAIKKHDVQLRASLLELAASVF